MKTTAYFRHTRKRRDRAWIKIEWIERALRSPVATQIQTDGRVRRWTWIEETGKYLRVVTLADGATVHNAFFDKDFCEEQEPT
jgi:hypothetical protein